MGSSTCRTPRSRADSGSAWLGFWELVVLFVERMSFVCQVVQAKKFHRGALDGLVHPWVWKCLHLNLMRESRTKFVKKLNAEYESGNVF